MTDSTPDTAMPDDVTLNRLAQRFYEVSGIRLTTMTDKPLIVKGLRAVFRALADGDFDDDAATTERVYAVGVIRCYDEAGNEVKTYVEGGPGKVSLIAMSDGTVRWAK